MNKNLLFCKIMHIGGYFGHTISVFLVPYLRCTCRLKKQGRSVGSTHLVFQPCMQREIAPVQAVR